MSSRLYVWERQHRGHVIEREVMHVLDDDVLSRPPASEVTLRCEDCSESLRLELI